MGNPAESDEQRIPIARQVDGGPKLGKWLKKRKRSQVWLSKQTDIIQQLLSAYIHQQARPQPMSVNARRIERATEGGITVWDWLTAEERAEFRTEDRLGEPGKG